MKSYGTLRHLKAEPIAQEQPREVPVETLIAAHQGRSTWEIKATPQVMMRLKRLFPRVNAHRTGTITVVATREVERDLLWVLDRWPLEMTDEDADRLRRGAAEHIATERTVEQILTGNTRMTFAQEVEGAREYQLQAADLTLSTGRLLVADDLGLGKSLTGLLILREPQALPALVVCQTHLPRQWLRQLNQWLPWLRGHIAKVGTPYELDHHHIWREGTFPKREDGEPDVVILGYSKLAGWADHLAGNVRSVIFDECQELRREGSLKYTAAGQVADQADYSMGLTATPVYNYGGEIHNIYSVLAPDALGTRKEFEREWGLMMSSGHLGVKEPGALGHHLRDQALLLRRTRKDVGRELPEVVRVPHSIDTDEAVVDELSGDALGLAELIISQTADHKEVWKASGDFDWRLRHATGVAKAPYVAEFVRMLLESGEQVVLYGWHHDVYEIWGDRLQHFNPALYTGQESVPQKERSKQAFLDRDSQVLMMSLRSGAGLDGLQEVASVVVFGELDWSPGVHDQCIGRLHRDGQNDPVVAYFLVSDAGADPVMADVLNLKRQQAEAIRDPDAELLAEAPNAHDRVRKLAEEYLRRQKAGTVLEAAA